jgi:hypothetical protein
VRLVGFVILLRLGVLLWLLAAAALVCFWLGA